MDQARLINECLHAYGIHSATLQPEFANMVGGSGETTPGLRQRIRLESSCQIGCGTVCEPLTCCG